MARKNNGLNNWFTTICCALAIMLTQGCSQPQETTFKTYTAPEAPKKTRIAFIGNSLTLHAPKPEIGWTKNNGMAASRIENDYAHLLINELKIAPEESYIRNFYPFESDGSVAKEHIKSLNKVLNQKPEIVVIQLGDNVQISKRNPIKSISQLYNFWYNYKELIQESKKYTDNIYCVSTWWESKQKDYVIKSQCEANGGKYVYIGDIYKNPANTDRKKIDYLNTAVDGHPKDYGMLQISLKLSKAIREYNETNSTAPKSLK